MTATKKEKKQMKNENREKDYKAGQEAGRCPLCEINLYSMPDREEPWPAVFPCGVSRKGDPEFAIGKVSECPYETEEEQAAMEMTLAGIVERLLT